MSFLDKVKNMFIEEVEEDEPIKKEVIQVKIPTPVEEKETVVKEEIKPEPIEKKEEIKKHVPTFFDDSDFEDLVDEPKKTELVKTLPKDNLYTKKNESNNKQLVNIYNGRRDNAKKNFTPTPIISPVYGVLNKNYKKGEITSKNNKSKNNIPIIHSEVNTTNIDDVRNKAFGTLEDEIDINLINNDELLLDNNKNLEDNNKEDEIKEQSPIDIFAELENDEKIEKNNKKQNEKKDNLDALDKLLNSYDFSNTSKSNIQNVLNDNIEKKDEKINPNKDLNDSELFNLIDAMYEKKDGE